METLARTVLRHGAIAVVVSMIASVAVADDAEIDLKIGDAAPAFEGTVDSGMKWTSSDFVGKKYVVVYFYPADFTTGCTRQAESWRDNMNALTENGVEVIGVSGDSVDNHKLFKQAWKLNYTLLADETGNVAKQFGVPVRPGGRVRPRGPDREPLTDENGDPLVLERKATFARWTYVIGKDGKVIYKNTRAIPAKDSEEVLEFIKNLNQESAKP